MRFQVLFLHGLFSSVVKALPQILDNGSEPTSLNDGITVASFTTTLSDSLPNPVDPAFINQDSNNRASVVTDPNKGLTVDASNSLPVDSANVDLSGAQRSPIDSGDSIELAAKPTSVAQIKSLFCCPKDDVDEGAPDYFLCYGRKFTGLIAYNGCFQRATYLLFMLTDACSEKNGCSMCGHKAWMPGQRCKSKPLFPLFFFPSPFSAVFRER